MLCMGKSTTSLSFKKQRGSTITSFDIQSQMCFFVLQKQKTQLISSSFLCTFFETNLFDLTFAQMTRLLQI